MKGLIEYLDVMEEERALIAMDQSYLSEKKLEYTHCELHPAMMFGICASFIPFSNHNQSTKNTLSSAMVKQALGMGSSHPHLRMDSNNHQLYYPQIPLVQTKTAKYTSVHALPSGINTVVALAVFTGYNQEDSIIVNQSAIERGLYRSVFHRTHEVTEKMEMGGGQVVVARPDLFQKSKERNFVDYNGLDSDGLARPGAFCEDEQLVIGQVRVAINNSLCISAVESLVKDVSVRMRKGERGRIDTVLLTENGEGYKLAKVKTRSVKIPVIGDKFACRHGQKGTIGMTFRQ
jgi:DNA-directed RNA polymerase II subunit RPB2